LLQPYAIKHPQTKKHHIANANKKNRKNRKINRKKEKIHEKITTTSQKNTNTTKIIKKLS
jgi:hypothetical protein